MDLNGEVLGVPVGRTEGQKQLVLTTLRSTLTDWKTISEIVSLPQKNIFFVGPNWVNRSWFGAVCTMSEQPNRFDFWNNEIIEVRGKLDKTDDTNVVFSETTFEGPIGKYKWEW